MAQATPANRWFTIIFYIVFFQGVFYGSVAVCLYSLLFLDIELMFFLALVSVLQRFARRSQKFIDLTVKYTQPLNYFKSFQRIYEEPIPEDEAALFSMHPHSVLSYCVVSNMNADGSKMSQMTGLASRFLLGIPFTGLQLRLWGIESVNARNINKLMRHKKPIGLLPGGFEQASLTSTEQLRIFINNRKGFIKYALKHNYTIYPVLAYNEHKAFWTYDGLRSLRLKLTKLKIPSVIFGKGLLWLFLPLNLEMATIVGRGIRRVHKTQAVSNEEIDLVHQAYIKEIERMHQKYREQFGESPLVIY